MSGIKNLLLQNDIFNEEETKILSVLSVCKLNTKKSRATSILVLISENSGFESIVEVKVHEKGQEFKKKRSWQIDQLNLLDMRYNEHEFEFVLANDEKIQFAAILLNEKQVMYFY